MTAPLAGIRVLDLSRILAGPWCTQMLADLGAEVIKVERPGTGDDTRAWGPPFLPKGGGGDTTDSAYFASTNRGKKSITLDIADAEGQAIARALAATCDVFVENYKVGDMPRYGLDYGTIAGDNPRLVYCSVTGFGQTGPYRARAGYDFMIQAMGGLMSITGERDDLPRLPATATDFDRSFGLAGIATLNFGTSVDTSDGVVTRDGNIVVVGRTFFPTSDVAVARFRRDGSVDSSFGINGSRVIPIGSGNDRGSAVYELPDGRLLIAGTFFDGTITNSFVLRLTGNGSLDVSFGNGRISTVPSTLAMQACCIAISGEGNPIIAGTANTSFTTYSFSVLRFLPNGGFDGSFGINGRILTKILGLDGPSAMCVSPDGRILVVGASSESASSSAHMTLARYLSNGVLDVSFNGSGIIRYTGFVSSELRAVSVAANGSILVAGRTVGANSNFLLAIFKKWEHIRFLCAVLSRFNKANMSKV